MAAEQTELRVELEAQGLSRDLGEILGADTDI